MFTAPNIFPQRITRILLTMGVVCVPLMILSGCRSARDNQIDILESELRSQEDYIYELEDYVVEYSDKLRGCRSCEPSEIIVHEESSEPDFVDAEPLEEPEDHTVNQQTEEEPSVELTEESLPEPEQTQAPPEEEEPQEEAPTDPADIEVPELEFEIEDPVGQQELSPDEYEEAETLFAEDDVEGQLVSIPDPAETEFETVVDTGDEEFINDSELVEIDFEEEEDIQIYRQAERIVVTKILRGGDRETPANALLTIVEARDANNEPVDLDGMVSLMVMTKDKESRQRLKRWDFSEEETLTAWQSSQLGDGLHLELPLGEAPLSDDAVELWARLMTNDGRKLLARLPFQQATLATLDEEPRPLDQEATEQALAKAIPLGGQAEVPIAASEPKQPAAPKTQWRASIQAAHLATDSKTTSGSTNGWKASRENVAQAEQTSSTKKPVWTTGRSAASSSTEQH